MHVASDAHTVVIASTNKHLGHCPGAGAIVGLRSKILEVMKITSSKPRKYVIIEITWTYQSSEKLQEIMKNRKNIVNIAGNYETLWPIMSTVVNFVLEAHNRACLCKALL